MSSRSRARTVYFFTRSFPFGIGEEWKLADLRQLVLRAERVVVVPYSYAGNYTPRELPPGVELRGPIFADDPSEGGRTALVKAVCSPRRGYFLRELFASGAWRRKQWLASWIAATRSIDELLDSPVIRTTFAELRDGDVVAFFWGRGSCDIVPFLPTKPSVRSVVRMHRYDLFESVNDGYIPFRRDLLRASNEILPSSNAGVSEIRDKYPQWADKVRLTPMGGGEAGRTVPSDDDVLRVVTCSLVAPVKRLNLLADALAETDYPVEWTHIGDGPLFEDLQRRVVSLPDNVQVNLVGWVHPSAVAAFYLGRKVDLFVNVSDSEGVPVSIQEALSTGTPVVATDVGGTADVVDGTVGELVPRAVTPIELAAAITRFRALSPDQRASLRAAARKRWEAECDADKLASNFADVAVGWVD